MSKIYLNTVIEVLRVYSEHIRCLSCDLDFSMAEIYKANPGVDFKEA